MISCAPAVRVTGCALHPHRSKCVLLPASLYVWDGNIRVYLCVYCVCAYAYSTFVSLALWDCAGASLLSYCRKVWSLVRAFLNDMVYLSVLWYVQRKLALTASGGNERKPQQVPPHHTKCQLFPGWLTQSSSWKEQTFKTLWHVSETLPLSHCCWCSRNWQHPSRPCWLGDIPSLVSVSYHPRQGLISSSFANINSIRRRAEVQREDICWHTRVFHSECVLEKGTRWRINKVWSREQPVGSDLHGTFC